MRHLLVILAALKACGLLTDDGGTFTSTHSGAPIRADIFGGIRWTHGAGATSSS